jgi:polyisoprenyl-phosphate glycosyltransferase
MGEESVPVLSVVVPLFNEVECLPELYQRLVTTLDGLGEPWEIVAVDDGSTDGTTELVERMAREDARVKPLIFARNFGHQVAVTAGLEHARGQAVVVMDADLQDPPELVAEFVERWREGYLVVAGSRFSRADEGAIRRFANPVFYRLLQRIVDFPIALDAGDFRLLDRRVVEVLNSMPERHRFLRGMSAWTGFKQTSVRYERPERFAGRSKYPFRKSLRLAMDGITSFSYLPLRLMTVVGSAVALITGLALPVVLVLRLAGVAGLYGQTTVVIAVMFFGGVQLLSIGILGDYLGRVYDEVKARPLYVLRPPSPRLVASPTADGEFVDEDGVADLGKRRSSGNE